MINRTSRLKAFTLVELAIVITIIGLLIGGVLKGQELLQNARVLAQVNQVRAFQYAMVTFKTGYLSLPGDIVNPGAILQGCQNSPCNASGNGDGMINSTPGGATVAVNNYMPCNGNTMEGRTFWLHLEKVGLISGIDGSGTWTGSGSNCGTWGVEAPKALLVNNGGFRVASYRVSDADYPMSGIYFVLQEDSKDPVQSGNTAMHPSIALKLDLKMDDGLPRTGNLQNLYPTCMVGYTSNRYNIAYVPPQPYFQGCNPMFKAM